MKHSEYIKLTSLLKGMAGNAGTLREVFSRVEIPADTETLEPGQPAPRPEYTDQAKQHPRFRFKHFMLDGEEKAVRETLDLMDRTVDSWTDENQERADRNQGRADNERLGPTADFRELYSAMSVFMDATQTRVPGAGALYIRVRKKCRAWMDQALTWFPELYPPFIRELLTHPDYLKAVNETHQITAGFTWNESIKDLAGWLDDTGLLSTPNGMSLSDRTSNNWMLADRVFQIDGKPVTAKQLRNAMKH